jgi:hypothetical protein
LSNYNKPAASWGARQYGTTKRKWGRKKEGIKKGGSLNVTWNPGLGSRTEKEHLWKTGKIQINSG